MYNLFNHYLNTIVLCNHANNRGVSGIHFQGWQIKMFAVYYSTNNIQTHISLFIFLVRVFGHLEI